MKTIVKLPVPVLPRMTGLTQASVISFISRLYNWLGLDGFFLTETCPTSSRTDGDMKEVEASWLWSKYC
jgi:hypothetical protein